VSRITPNPLVQSSRLTLDDPIDTYRLFVEVFKTSRKPHPGLFFSFQASLEFLPDSLVTKARRGRPRWAATDLARRKMGSGISRVVFTLSGSHIYGRWLIDDPKAPRGHQHASHAFHCSRDDGNAGITPEYSKLEEILEVTHANLPSVRRIPRRHQSWLVGGSAHRKGLRPGLFNPCSAPALPVQTWGTRQGTRPALRCRGRGRQEFPLSSDSA
jgi:hypothetical protein